MKAVAHTCTPMIISTVLADIQEIQEVIDAAREVERKERAIFYCVSSYQLLAEDYNLKTLGDMQS